MKRITLVGLAIVAALGMMAASASAEGTGPKVTLRTAAGPLKKGAPLGAFSSNLVLVTAGGNQECSKNTLSGTIKTNTREKASGEIALAESSGQEGEGRCKSTGTFGPPFAAWQNLPWNFKFINTGTLQMNTGAGDKHIKIAYTFPAAGGAKCIYSIKKVLSTFPVSATPVPLVITTTNQRFTLVAGSVAGCPTEGKLNGSFSTTSSGEAVEVEVK